MSDVSLDFDVIFDGDVKTENPIHQNILIIAKSHYISKNGYPVISPPLVNNFEIDAHIENLKNQLDKVGKEAKKKLFEIR